MDTEQIKFILDFQQTCDQISLPIWLESGWSVDARLGYITREHEDVDLAIPAERMEDFKLLLNGLGADHYQETDYGFLAKIGTGILLDCEPCVWNGSNYELKGVPPGSCPMEKQGILAGVAVRCTSWEAILWEYFYYLEEVPFISWPIKDQDSYKLVNQVVGERHVAKLYDMFQKSHS